MLPWARIAGRRDPAGSRRPLLGDALLGDALMGDVGDVGAERGAAGRLRRRPRAFFAVDIGLVAMVHAIRPAGRGLLIAEAEIFVAGIADRPGTGSHMGYLGG